MTSAAYLENPTAQDRSTLPVSSQRRRKAVYQNICTRKESDVISDGKVWKKYPCGAPPNPDKDEQFL